MYPYVFESLTDICYDVKNYLKRYIHTKRILMKVFYDGKEYACSFEFALYLVSGKWKGLILWHLSSGTLRYGELKKNLGKITQKMLTQTLRELEKNQLIIIADLDEIPSGTSSELKKYINDGGSVLLFPGTRSNLSSYNQFFSKIKAIQLNTVEEINEDVGHINLKQEVFQSYLD